jgi:hypothetical protein
MTHEDFIQGIRKIVCSRVPDDLRVRIEPSKLAYGAGEPGVRGTTYYEAWQTGETRTCFVTVNATGEESVTQLAGTTIHELGHVVAGSGAGHGLAWKESCKLLGLVHADAAGQCYAPDHFNPDLWQEIVKLGQPLDGNPTFSAGLGIPFHGIPKGNYRPCPLGIGTRGGTSRGKGSGSRLVLFTCQCIPDASKGISNKARQAGNLDATCNRCHTVFTRSVKVEPGTHTRSGRRGRP